MNKDLGFKIFAVSALIIIIIIVFWMYSPNNNSILPYESDLDLTGRLNISNNTMQIGYAINSSYSGNLTIMNRTKIMNILTINDNNGESIAKFYGNGTVWIRDKQEAKAAEQLIKFGIAYSSYLNGFCDGVRK